MNICQTIFAALVLNVVCSCATASDLADESFRIAETQRLDQIARQLDLNYRMIWQSGYGPRYPDPFEPWPRVPGDIWGYPSPRPIEHPVGFESKQTRPNRWIYRPIYAAEVNRTTPSAPSPTPANLPRDVRGKSQRGVVAPEKPRPSDLAEPDAKPRPSGPRAF